MNLFRFVLALSLGLFMTACNHTGSKNQESPREPAAQTESHATHLPDDQIKSLQDAAAKQDSSRVHELLSGVRVAQILVSSFDARLAKISKEEDADKLMNSQLYCRLQEVRPLQEAIDEKLRVIFAAALQQGAPGREWMYQQLRAFAKVDVLNEVAVMQVIRLLAENEETYCGAKDCFTTEATKWPELHVNPMDDEAMAKYVGTRMAKYKTVTKSDVKPGNCFGDRREPNQVGAYDWKSRNWVGSVLPQGNFVFTYDDGPHSTFTKEIRDAWAQAGMVKPAFFWLSKNATNLPSIVSELNSQGYVIGSHSADHKDLGALAKAGNTTALDYQINGSVATLTKNLGKQVRYFRLPYGSGVKSQLIGARFQALNLDHFFWRVDSLDWQDKNPASIRDRVVAQMKATGRGIVLFHDIHSQSAKATQLVVNYLKTSSSHKAVSILDLPGLQK
ncbi:polysaccharide deacetylase family protein [Bdellovibrio sp. HCB337]|uniref:polysaccharide deacetylase family protein n=1 Tax=Bdellovibrio sp. HCB337 TaxID=3394358 RepID=UPI0039A42E53